MLNILSNLWEDYVSTHSPLKDLQLTRNFLLQDLGLTWLGLASDDLKNIWLLVCHSFVEYLNVRASVNM